MFYLPRLWFGVREPVSRSAYLLSGLTLALVKYAVEATLIFAYTATLFPPWQFVNPVLSVRLDMLQTAPPWLGWALFAWSLPFVWIAITMSVRRAADAGGSPWQGLLVLVPLVNLVFMAVMSVAPTAPGMTWLPRSPTFSRQNEARDAALALGMSLMAGATMLTISVYWLASYGAALFFGTPLLMGAVAGYQFNRAVPRSFPSTMGLGLGTVAVAGLALLLFALEGVFCIAMALPLLMPLGLFGGVLGKAIADSSRRPAQELLAVVALLPLMAVVESYGVKSRECEITTVVEVNAPPEAVWNQVLSFPELPPATEWHFRLGIACPQRARIVGSGVGATRYCEFTTGTFVEPITAWVPGRCLAFDVTDQPEPMFELTPYRHVHPPHLQGYLKSNRGEFRLIPLAAGRTRLEGHTWYESKLYPAGYWSLWADALIHSIHHRVLQHVKQRAEEEHPEAPRETR